MTTKKMSKSDLLALAVESIKNAENNSKEYKALADKMTALGETFVSSVEVACADAYKASLAGVTGADIASGSGVSAMTVSRYIAGGHVAYVTKGKVSGGKVVSDIGNGNITCNRAKSVKSASEYQKQITANKKTAKSGKAKAKATLAPLDQVAENIDQIVKFVRSGKVTLEQVTDIWATGLAMLDMADDLELAETE